GLWLGSMICWTARMVAGDLAPRGPVLPSAAGGGMATGQVAEGERGADRRAAARVRGAEPAGRGVAGRVQPGDGRTVVAEDARVAVDTDSAAGAERPVVQANGVERGLLHRGHAPLCRGPHPCHVGLEAQRP